MFGALPERITFTVDVEEDGTGPAQALAMTARLLDLLDETGAKGSFFVVGTLAEAQPALVRAIAARGHEIGCHGHHHRALAEERPEGLRADLARARAVLEDQAGAAVQGFRAPLFSLTPVVPWVPSVLAEAGFTYSSSVLPARNWLHGWPGAPRAPFLWPSGVLEIPVPLARLGPLELPVLGGMYLRYIPPWDLRRMARRLGRDGAAVWSYCHPYDLDAEARFTRRAETGLAGSLFLWMNRGAMARRLRAVLEGRRSVPFAARLGEFREGAAVFSPSPALAGEGRGGGSRRGADNPHPSPPP